MRFDSRFAWTLPGGPCSLPAYLTSLVEFLYKNRKDHNFLSFISLEILYLPIFVTVKITFYDLTNYVENQEITNSSLTFSCLF